MCGIAGVLIKDPSLVRNHEGLEEFVDILFCGIESRGRRATGFVAVGDDGTVRMDKAPVSASEFIKTRERLPENTRAVLLHTRLDTQGSPQNFLNNHPVIHKTCFAVHNGWIRNDDDLYEKYGFDRAGEVDSEIIAAMVYNADFDIDKLKEAFDEMQGGIACASIDPIRHPGKIILARTETSPLMLIDTPKFVVWASERQAIQEAWGQKLGTPPGDKKIEEIKRNQLLIVSAEGIERHDIPTTHTVTRTWTPGNGQYVYQGRGTYTVPPTTPTTTKPDSTRNGSVSSSPIILTKDIREVVESLRNRDTHVARLWDDRHKVEFAIQLGPWTMCECCHERVHYDDIRDSLKGRLCVDCYAAWMTLAAAARPTLTLTGSDFDDVNTTFTKEQTDKFSTWANDEDFVHQMCLRELSIHTEFSEEAIEFLLFRLTTADEELVEGLREWRINMMTLYDQEYEENWSLYDADGEMAGMKQLITSKPPKAQLALMPAPTEVKVRFTPTPSRDKKCANCRRKVKVVVERADTHEYIGFCNKHFTTCSCRGCYQNANHVSVDGERLCHAHARGRDAYADTLLVNEGFTVGRL